MDNKEMTSSVSLVDNMHFNGELDGFTIPVDADPEFGGENKGPKPKGLVLTALCGCTGMDVVSILRKMKVNPTSLHVTAKAELSENHPKVFTKIHLTYTIGGKDIPLKKIDRAVVLSQENYCGVSAMLSSTVKIDYSIILE